MSTIGFENIDTNTQNTTGAILQFDPKSTEVNEQRMVAKMKHKRIFISYDLNNKIWS